VLHFCWRGQQDVEAVFAELDDIAGECCEIAEQCAEAVDRERFAVSGSVRLLAAL
jgi:hypothetical protein